MARTWLWRATLLAVLCAGVVALWGCGDDDDGGHRDAGPDASVDGGDAGGSDENPAVALSVAPARLDLVLGTSGALTANLKLRDGHTLDATSDVSWSTDDQSVAIVDNSGHVRAVAAGLARISAKLEGLRGGAVVAVRDVELVAIALDPSRARLAIGSEQSLRATGRFSDGSMQVISDSVRWSSHDSTVATVDAHGVVRAVGLGSTTIGAELSGVSASSELTVSGALVTSIDVTPASATVELGGAIPLVASAVFDDGSTQDITHVASWSSADDAIASVSEDDGLVTGVSAGTTKIHAQFRGQQGNATIEVSGEAVVAIAISPALPAALPLGASQQFQLTGTLAGGGSVDLTENANVSFESSNPVACAIANTAGSKGVATALSLGTTTIAASFVGFGHVLHAEPVALDCTNARLVSLALGPNDATVPATVELPFTAIGTYTDGSTRDETERSDWASSDGDVASVSNTAGSKGVALALLPGDATVLVTQLVAGVAIDAQAVLHVDLGVLSLVRVKPLSAQVAIGATRSFTATGVFSDGYSYDLTRTVAWSVSDPQGTPARASISNASGSEGLLSALDFTDPSDRGDDLTVIATAPGGGVHGSAKLVILTDVVDEVQLLVGSRASHPTLPFLPDLCYSDGCPDLAQKGGPIPLGNTAQAYAVCRFEDGRFELCNARATFVASAPAVLSVSNAASSKGVVSALTAGSSDLTIEPLGSALIHPAVVGTSDCPVQSLSVDTFDPLQPAFTPVPSGPGALEIPAGTSRQLRVRALLDLGAGGCSAGPSAGANGYDATAAASWSSSDGAVADVNNLVDRGLVGAERMPASPFQTTISATFGGRSDGGLVHVSAACLIALQITPSDPVLPFVRDYDPLPPLASAGVHVQFGAVGVFSDGSSADVTTDVDWSIDDGQIAAIDDDGVLQTLGVGRAEVHAASGSIATCDGAVVTGAVDIEVAARRLTSLTIAPEQPLLARGASLQLTATGVFDDDVAYDLSRDVVWQSSNTNVATVTGDGLVFGADQQQGTTIVSAAYAGVSTDVPLAVQGRKAQSVSLAFGDSLCAASGAYPVGIEIPLQVIAQYEDGGSEDVTASVLWSSSAKGVAMASDGRAVTLAPGSAQLTASFGGVDSPALLLDVRAATLDTITVKEQRSGLDTGWEIPQGVDAQFIAAAHFTFASPSGAFVDGCDVTRVVQWSAPPGGRLTIDAATGLARVGLTSGAASVTATSGAIIDISSGTVASACLNAIEAVPSAVMTPVGTPATVQLQGVYSDGSRNDALPFAFESSDTDVLTLTPGVTPGSFVVTGANGASSRSALAAFSLDESSLPGVICPGRGVLEVEVPVLIQPAELASISVDCGADAHDFGGATSGETLPPGVPTQCIATGHFSDGSSADVSAVASWDSTLSAVAGVSAGGALLTIAPGTTSVSATIDLRSGAADVIVNDASVQALAVVPADQSRPVGFTLAYHALASFTLAGGNTFAGYDVTSRASWSSSAPEIATADDRAGNEGLVTTVASDVAPVQIMAAYGGQPGQTNLTVNSGVPISLSITGASDPHRGSGLQLNAIASYDDPGASTRDVSAEASWGSSDSSVFAAPVAGSLTAANQGSAFATAQYGALSDQVSITVLAPCIEAIELSPPSATIPRDVPLDFQVVATLSDGSSALVSDDVDWSTSDSSRMAAPDAGYAVSNSAAQPGDVLITADALAGALNVCPDADPDDLVQRATIAISAATLTAIEVTPAKGNMPAGNQLQYTATGVYSDDTRHDITRRCVWSSADPFVAEIASGIDDPDSGLVSGRRAGTTTVSASQGALSDAAIADVRDAELLAIEVLGLPTTTGLASDNASRCPDRNQLQAYSSDPLVIPDGGFTSYARALGHYSDGLSREITELVTWSSSDDASATVSDATGDKGRIVTVYDRSDPLLQDRALTISAATGNKTGTLPLTISDLFLNALTINREHVAEPDPFALALGTQSALHLHGRFGTASGVLAATDRYFCIDQAASWSENGSGAVQVSNAPATRGLLTGQSLGSAIVTAQVGALSDVIDVDVVDAEVVSLVIAPDALVLPQGDSAQLQAIATLSDGSVVDITHPLGGTTTWSSQDGDVASVSASGLVSIDEAGTTEIDACARQPVGGREVCASDQQAQATITGR